MQTSVEECLAVVQPCKMYEFQRTRIVSAMTAVACEHGVQFATVARVTSRAGISRRTFYEIFENRNDCLMAAIEQTVVHVVQRTRAAVESQTLWTDRIRMGLHALLEFCEEEPGLARLCVVQTTAAGPTMLARRSELFDRLAAIIDEGRAIARRKPPPLTAEGVVGGALSVIYSRLIAPERGGFLQLLSPLMSFIVFPYLGASAAHRELHRPVLVGRSKPVKEMVEPLSDLGMRLTYRTVKVLAAIESQAGLSNREVGDRAGIADQGQISRLLARLARLELIENFGHGHSKGVSNAWELTDRGRAVGRSLAQQGALQRDDQSRSPSSKEVAGDWVSSWSGLPAA